MPSVWCPEPFLGRRGTATSRRRGGKNRSSLTAGSRSRPGRSELLPRRRHPHPRPFFPSRRLSFPSLPPDSCSISRRRLWSSSALSAAPERKRLRGGEGEEAWGCCAGHGDQRGWEKPGQTHRARITPRYCPIFFKMLSANLLLGSLRSCM